MKRILGTTIAAIATALILAGCGNPMVAGGKGIIGESRAISSNQTGTNNGFYYSFWTNGSGSASMDLGSAGNYSVNWSNIGDFTCGKGWSTGSGHTIGYNAGIYQNSGGGALALYGWTTNPLVEYYIAESYNGITSNATNLGTFTTDDGTYTIYKHQQVNQPSIIGNNQTFWQYISVRQSQRTAGTITIQNHFNAWASKGLNLGTQNMQIMLTEGWNGSGQSNVTVWEGGGGSTPTPTAGPTPTPGSGGTSLTLNSWQANSHSSNLTIWTGGVGGWNQGDWIQFNGVNITGKSLLNFNLASANGGSYKIVLDSYNGTQIGTMSFGATGGWNTYVNKSATLNLNGNSGSHNLIIIDTSGAANLGTLTLQ